MIDLGVAAGEIVGRYPPGRGRSAILPLLHLAQERDGYVTEDAMAEIGTILGMSPAQVLSVASFYSMLHLRPKGRHVISVCHNIACALNGAERVIGFLEGHLGVECGETTPDGEFTLERAECLAACDLAPMIQVDYDAVTGPVTPASVIAKVERLRSVARGEEAGVPEPPPLVDSIPLTEAEERMLRPPPRDARRPRGADR